ncbi:MAG: YfiR family protein [Gammaproteobacteria bacterium]|nr:YfiR family protein [Gammaproteobacteria bacterium]
MSWFAAGLICTVLLAHVPVSPGRDLPEHQIKAAVLFNFAAFVSWPESLFETPLSPLRYCVVGADALHETLNHLISGERLEGRPMELLNLDEESSLDACHILFLGGAADYDKLAVMGLKPGILTVGDSESFIEQGGMIALLRKRKRIHPVINLDALDQSRLRLSSKLLHLATLVRPGSNE